MTDFSNTVQKIQIRKDTFFHSRPWAADVHWKDGKVWVSWQSRFRTQKALLETIAGLDDNLPALVVGVPRKRRQRQRHLGGFGPVWQAGVKT